MHKNYNSYIDKLVCFISKNPQCINVFSLTAIYNDAVYPLLPIQIMLWHWKRRDKTNTYNHFYHKKLNKIILIHYTQVERSTFLQFYITIRELGVVS